MRSPIPRAFSTFLAFVDDDKSFLAILIDADGFQKTLTRREPISGTVTVDVLRTKAARTVVTVRAFTKRLYRFLAVFTGEGLFARDEWHGLCIEEITMRPCS